MGRARGPCLAVPSVLDGPHRAEPGGATSQRGPATERRSAAVDRGHLRLSGRRIAHHDGNLGRPNWPAATAADRRRGIRRRLGSCGVLVHGVNADCRSRDPRRRVGDACALDTLIDPQHVSRSTRTNICCGCVDRQLLRRWRARSLAGRVAAGALLVGLRVSHERARHAAVAGPRPRLLPEYRDPNPGRWIRRALRCRSWQSSR